ncbi:MAG: FadR family transcriptional regulator [Firmicutes bacterium HGW-Firmicutes-7]|nr:MAG: FadR family transcriptional regulator [Firmicutes bacterium HGW-Firmicutes-7]
MNQKSYLNESLGGKSIVDKIVDSITNAIINGELKPGDKIPTETELCESMGVGRNSVREAIKILDAYGVLHIKRAEGTFVNKEYNSKMLYPILYGIILQQDSANQIIELRKVIDIGILQIVISKLTKEKLKPIVNALKELENEIYSPEATARKIFEADVKFHSEIVFVTENVMLESIGYYVDKITRQSRMHAIDQILELKAEDKFLELHKNLVKLLVDKEAKSVSNIVEDHYQFWQKEADE